jgi:hypothetical protein
MRTTVTLDASLLDDLKRRAAERGTTVSRLIEDSVRLAMAEGRAAEPEGDPFELVTWGAGGNFTGFDADRTSALLERDDLERFGRGR